MHKTLIKHWLHFWTKPYPTRSLFVFKIAWATSFLFEVTTSWWPDWILFFGIEGPLRTDPILYRPNVWNVLSMCSADWQIFIFLSALTLLTVAVAFNKGGWAAVFLTWYLFSCFTDFTPAIRSSYHQFWRWFGFCLLLSPTPRWSLDSALKPIWTLRLIQIHVAMIYLYAAIAKSKTAVWQDGGIFAFLLASPGHLSVTGEAIAQWPIFQNYIVIKTLTWSALAVEAALPFLLFVRRFRWIGLILAVLLHFQILIIMDIDRFQIYMLAFLTAFIPWYRWSSENY